MTDAPAPPPLDVLQAAQVDQTPVRHHWLVDQLWGRQAVGVIGGPPKACKTWLGLDLAVSVASATPCLGAFEVEAPGPVLVYLAEDPLEMVRRRIEDICTHRGLDIWQLDLYVINAPALRLDVRDDRLRLQAALDRLRPALLLLDPLVRLHRIDENNSGDISRILGYLRGLQRHFELAVALVHHMGKRNHRRLGQALRGSGDIHAWADSSAYLLRNGDQLALELEHRSAPAPPPCTLQLVTAADGSAAHLEINDDDEEEDEPLSLHEAIRQQLARRSEPITRTELRRLLRVNNQRLGQALADLESRNIARREKQGWTIVAEEPPHTDDPRQLGLM